MELQVCQGFDWGRRARCAIVSMSEPGRGGVTFSKTS